MEKVKSVYMQLFFGAVIIFSIGASIMLSDMYIRIGTIEHILCHIPHQACPQGIIK